MITVAVLAGGTSDEREISLRSSKSVVSALEQAGFGVRYIDTGEVAEPVLREALQSVDVTFPVLHGKGGEDGTLQAWLEGHGYAYIGADSTASALCFDKWQFKQSMQELGIRTPEGAVVDTKKFKTSPLTQQPYVLKPIDGGSSVDTFIVRDPVAADLKAIRRALKKYGKMLIEELIEGQEITVSVFGDKALPVVEIIPPADGEFDYENKYNGKSSELCPPQHIAEDVQRSAAEISEKIHAELNIRDMSRTDIMVRETDSALFVLETNTIPGLTDQSLFPKAAAAAGYSMEAFVTKLVHAALERKRA